jgi:hypothetical protein
MSFEEYSDLAQTGYQGGSSEQTPPEEEFFHSVYISGKTRKNHINIEEEVGKFQIRGLQYNLDEVNMIITHTKEILANIKNEKGRDNIVCFSYKDGSPPWYGTSKLGDGQRRQCPQTSAERAVNDFCSPCRTQILVAGIYCKSDGTPILTEEKKPIFIFIRGKGTRYPNISNYLNDRFNEEDLSPIFEPVTEQSKQFEKSVVNNKRFVTNITKGKDVTSFGNEVNVFVLNKGIEIPKESVISILKLSKQTVDRFNNKFDWSKRKQVSGYGQSPAEGVLPMDEEGDTSEPQEEGAGKAFSFDDINF